MQKNPKPYDDDFAIVTRSLKEARQFFEQHKYGGTMKQYKHALMALESLDKIFKATEAKQLELF